MSNDYGLGGVVTWTFFLVTFCLCTTGLNPVFHVFCLYSSCILLVCFSYISTQCCFCVTGSKRLQVMYECSCTLWYAVEIFQNPLYVLTVTPFCLLLYQKFPSSQFRFKLNSFTYQLLPA